MLRLVERVFGEGRLQAADAGEAPLTVGYELDVYRDWSVADGVLRPGEWVVDGHLLGPPGMLASLAGRGAPFDLRLDDTRRLQVFVLDAEGHVVNVEGTTITECAVE